MYCKVCGNFLSETDKVCEVCGNDVEQQRKQELAATEAAKSVGYAQREEKSEIDREKDDAINRIFYEGDGADAHSRLEERRRKRAQEKTGLSGFFAGRSSQESVPKPEAAPAAIAPNPVTPTFEIPTFKTPIFETSVKEKAKPEIAVPGEKPIPRAERFSLGRIDSVHVTEPAKPAPPQAQAPEEDRPRRNFHSEFVFGARPTPPPPESASAPEPEFDSRLRGNDSVRPVYEPTAAPVPDPPAASEPLFTPAPAEAYTPAPAPAPTPELTPVPDDFFALKVDEAEQALFDINKKNEEFQELLDEEFERLRRGGAVASEAKSLVSEEILTEAEQAPEILVTGDNARELAQDRIDDYLKRADLDMLKEIQARLEKELAGKATSSIDPWAQAKREPAPVPGFTFDGKDYGHALSHGAAPVSDVKTAAEAFIAQAEKAAPKDEIILSQETAPKLPEREDPQNVSYSILDEMFGGIPGKGEADETSAVDRTQLAPSAPVCDPGVTATREPAPVPGFAFDDKDFGHAFSHGAAPVSDLKTNADAFLAQETEGLSADEAVLAHETDLEFTAPTEESSSAPASYTDFEIFDFSTATPEPAPEPEPVLVPVPEPLPTPIAAESSALPVGWGRSAPTREQAQDFLSRPIAFPFDEPGRKPVPEPEPEPGLIAAPEPEPIAVPKPEPVVVPEPAKAPAPELRAESAPAPVPLPQTGSEILSSQPQWHPEVSFVGLLAPQVEEAPAPETLTEETPAPKASAPKDAVALTADLLTEVPDAAATAPMATATVPAAATEAAISSVFEPITSPMPAFDKPPIPGLLPEVSPLPTTPAAISYDDALAAPTITGTPGTPVSAAEPRTEEHAADLGETTKKNVSAKLSKLQRNVISVIITVLIVILVIVVACIATLKFMPDSVGAFYILDFIETIQTKLSGG